MYIKQALAGCWLKTETSACVYWKFHVRVTSGPKYDVWLLLLKQRPEMDIK